MKPSLLLIFAVFLFAGCAPTRPLVSATFRPSYRSLPGAEGSKTFASRAPIRVGTFEIKAGSSITFRADGHAVFSCSIRGHGEDDEAALRIVARRANGTIAFQYPPHEHTYLPAKPAGVVTPYDVVFGFDPRLFPEIARVEWELTSYQ